MKDWWIFVRSVWWSWHYNRGGVVIYSREYATDAPFLADLTAAMKAYEKRRA